LSIVAEQWANKHASTVLAEKSKHWQKDIPTDAQLTLAKKLHVWHDGMSRGECSDAITHKLAMRVVGGVR
jgi:hypothetical protein